MIKVNYEYTILFAATVAGVGTAADSTPTAVLWRNGSASGLSVTVSTTAQTGLYKAVFTTDSGWASGDHLELYATATIAGTAGYLAKVWSSTEFATVVDAANSTIADISTRLPAALESGRIAAVLDSATTQKIDDILTDTGTTLPAQIAGIEGGGGSSVNVLPATGIVANRSPGVTLLPVVGETISQSITLYQSDGTTALDLSGKTLKIIFETMNGADVAVVLAADIAIGGTDDNVVTFAYPSAVTSSERVLRFAIRDAAAPLTMYLQGVCSVVAAPKVDA
jgi:hypothetical protein